GRSPSGPTSCAPGAARRASATSRCPTTSCGATSIPNPASSPPRDARSPAASHSSPGRSRKSRARSTGRRGWPSARRSAAPCAAAAAPSDRRAGAWANGSAASFVEGGSQGRLRGPMTRAPARLAALALATVLLAPACRLFHRRHAPATPAPVDLNRASLRTLEKLPGITPSMARRIVDGRPYEEPPELVTRGILTERELDRILDRVVVDTRAR